MNTHITSRLVLPVLLGLLSVARADTILLSDDFAGASLDPGKWQTILPFGQSSVVQNGGAATTTGRGILASVAEFEGSYAFNGAFTMNHDLEGFVIGFRTDLTALPELDLFNTLSGMFVAFSNDVNQISLQGRGFSPQNSTPNTHKNYQLNTGQTYVFSILDNGTDIEVWINGQKELFASTTVGTGGHVAFYSREFSSTSTSIDAVNMTAISDSGATGLLLAFACVGLIAVSRGAGSLP